MDEKTKFCVKCGKKIPNEVEFCPFCGAKQPNSKVNTTKKTASVSKTNKLKHKKLYFLIGASIVVIVCGGIGYKAYHDKKVADDKQAEIKAKEKEFNDTYQTFAGEAYTFGSKTESMTNKIASVWHDAIWNDNGVTIGGKQYTDFNKAISAQQTVWVTNGQFSKMENKLDDLREDHHTLSLDVTKKNSADFKKANAVYSLSKEFYNAVKSPNGNYNEYSNYTTDLDNKLSNKLSDING